MTQREKDLSWCLKHIQLWHSPVGKNIIKYQKLQNINFYLYWMFREFYNLSFTRKVPQGNRLIIRKTDNMYIICCKFAAVNRSIKRKKITKSNESQLISKALPVMSLKNSKKWFWCNVKKFDVSFITSSNNKFTIWSYRSTISCLFESCKMPVNLMCDWIVYLNFGSTRNSDEVWFYWHNIDVVNRSKFFDSNGKLGVDNNQFS